jgi:hypothetical protein
LILAVLLLPCLLISNWRASQPLCWSMLASRHIYTRARNGHLRFEVLCILNSVLGVAKHDDGFLAEGRHGARSAPRLLPIRYAILFHT